MATIVHFDISAENTERAKKFYEELFGWEFEKMEGMEYYLIQTSDSAGKAAIGGGMGKRANPEQRITNFIGVSSIDEYAVKIEQLGGKVIQPKTFIAGWGYLAICVDTETNSFGIWQDAEK